MLPDRAAKSKQAITVNHLSVSGRMPGGRMTVGGDLIVRTTMLVVDTTVRWDAECSAQLVSS